MPRMLAVVALLMVSVGSACFGAVAWFDTYEEAEKTAKEQGRPLVAIIVRKGDENVRAIKRLFTKRETAWATRVFVFCHEEVEVVNNTINSRVLAKFRFQGQLRLPYFFFADSEGKVLGQTADGSPGNIGDMLKIAYRRHGPVADPKKLEGAVARLKKADELYEKGQYGAAASLYSEVVEMKFKAPPVEAAKEKLAKIEEIANKQLEDARTDVKDKAYPAAVGKLAELARDFGSLAAGQAARKELVELRRVPEAEEAFAAAERRTAEGKAEPGAPVAVGTVTLDEADWKLDGFTDEELDALDAMAAGPGAETPSTDRTAEIATKCRRLLGLARNWIANNEPDKARRYLQQIIDEHPDTLFADQAKAILAGLK